jgi:integrase
MAGRNSLNKLTIGQVKNAKRREKVYRLTDGGGLVLMVHPTGSKLWIYRYKLDGKDQTASFGVWPEVSLADARDGRDDARKDMRAGITPKDRKRMQKRQFAEERRQWGHTFETVARKWHKETCKKRGANNPWTNDKHRDQVINTLKTYAFPKIGTIPIDDLRPVDVRKVIEGMKNVGKWETAQRVFQRISMVIDSAIERELTDSNPCDVLRRQKLFKNRPAAINFAALAPVDLSDLMKALKENPLQPKTETALMLSLLTAVRPGELRNAEWTEFDLEDKLWIIPAEKMKMGRDHVVPLSDQAIQILLHLSTWTGLNKYLFPHRSKGREPMSNGTVNQALKRLGFTGRTTAHGFRSTFSTWANESGLYQRDAIERQLAHVEGNKIRGAYNRAEYLEERTLMMQVWADYVTQCADPKVVQLKRKGVAK